MSANGKLADSELTTVDGWAQLTPNTARAYLAAKAYILAHFLVAIIISSPLGAYRSIDDQITAKAIYKALAATPGYSKHGLGIAFDMNNITTILRAVGGQAQLDAIMARFGFVRDASNGAGGIEQWHYTLVAVVNLSGLAGASELHDPIAPPPYFAPLEDDMFKLYYRQDAPTTASPSGITYALGVLDPSWQTPGHNFWFEATAESRRDWRELFGFRDVNGIPQAQLISADIWNSRSNDPNRISDVSKYLPLVASGAAVTNVPANPISDADVARIVKATLDAQAARLAN